MSLCAGSAHGYEFHGFIIGENSGDQFGAAACEIDFNHDGYPDLVISAPSADDNGASSGKVYLYFGGPGSDLLPDLTISGAAGSFFGQSLAPAGDFNADGFEDLVVGAPFYDLPSSNAGAVYLFYGGPDPDTAVDHIFTGERNNDYFGFAVAGVGDVNNDNIDDLVIGAYKADYGIYTDPGKAYVYYGNTGGDYVTDQVLTGTADGERFGCAVAGGDFTGDDVSDIAVGAYSFDGSELNQGRVYVFSGGQSVDSTASTVIAGDSAGYKFGWRLASGRVTADGYDDLIMGTDGVEIDTFITGGLYLFAGGAAFDDNPLFSYLPSPAATNLLGDAIASGTDLDGDGYHEMAAGMPGFATYGSLAGGAVTFSGGSPVTADTTLTSSTPGEEMGKSVTFWPGFGGAVGIVIGAPTYDEYRGRVYVYRSEVLSANFPPILEPIGSRSGNALALLSFTVKATDPNWTIPVLEAENLPDGAVFQDDGTGTGSFAWTPGTEDVGDHAVTFIASDGQYQDIEIVTVGVTDPYSCCHDYTGNTDCDPDEKCALSDITRLIDRVYLSKVPLCCEAAGNIDGDPKGLMNLADITLLIDHVYLSKRPTAPCP